MTSKPFDLALPSLMIDSANPRFETEQEDQRGAIRRIAEDQGEKLINLAEDITSFGLDPSSRVLVIANEGDGRFIVVEGNRRVAALKALTTPELVKGLWTGKREQRLKEISALFKAKPIAKVPCELLADRDAADHWLWLRHRGEQGGRGIVDWDGFEATRFEQRRGRGRAVAALEAIDLVRNGGDLDQETLDRIGDIPITTVQRVLNDPRVRRAIGVDLRRGKLQLRVPEAEALKGLSKIIRDAAQGLLPVSRVDTVADREEYIASFAKTDLPSSGVTLSDQRPVAGGSSNSLPKTRRREPSKKREVLIPKGFVLQIPHDKSNDIFHELLKLKLEDFSNAVSILLRVFLELSVDHYVVSAKLMKKPDLSNRDMTLRKKLTKAADNLQKTGVMTKRELTPIRRALDPSHFLAGSIDTLHAYVHDANTMASASDLRAAWSGLAPVFTHLWE